MVMGSTWQHGSKGFATLGTNHDTITEGFDEVSLDEVERIVI